MRFLPSRQVGGGWKIKGDVRIYTSKPGKCCKGRLSKKWCNCKPSCRCRCIGCDENCNRE